MTTRRAYTGNFKPRGQGKLEDRLKERGFPPEWAQIIRELARARYRLGLSGPEVAGMVGCDTNLIAKWECGIRTPTPNMLFCWCQALGVKLDIRMPNCALGIEHFRAMGRASAAVRMTKLTKAQRRALARNAARQRWAREREAA